MAKTKRPVNNSVAPTRLPQWSIMVAAIVIVALLITTVVFLLQNREDKLTAWATIKSRELNGFMQNCRDTGGEMQVRAGDAPRIVFVCQYLDYSREYTLSPGK